MPSLAYYDSGRFGAAPPGPPAKSFTNMISNPRAGQLVKVAYAPSRRGIAQSGGLLLHGQTGRIVIPSRGKPRNHGVEIAGRIVVIPAGQLQPTA
jgi:hypothetical protein